MLGVVRFTDLKERKTMGAKKGIARRLEIVCAVEEGDKAILTGPDDDGDLTFEMDCENEPEVSIVINRKNQEKLYAFLGKALGKKADDGESEN
jgi:hypothetical protein